MLDLDDALEQLAPQVDAAASRDLFDRRRSIGDAPAPNEGGRNRRLPIAIAAVIVLIVGIATIVVVGGDGDDPSVDTSRTGSSVSEPAVPETAVTVPQPPFLDIGYVYGVDPVQRVAVEQEQYDELWAKAQMARRPDIDLEHWVVAAVKQPESSCSPTLATLIRSGSTFTPVFNQGVCPLIPSETMYLFAIDRSLVTPGFTLEFEGTRTDVEVPAVTPFPSTPKPATPDGALGVVPLPRPGANRSALLDDGMPVWVVDHGDGTVSVLPAVAPAYDDLRSIPMGDGTTMELHSITGLWAPVLADASGSLFNSSGQEWDAYGRERSDRTRDLTGLTGERRGDWVVVTASDDPISGDPVGEATWEGARSSVLPGRTTSVDDLAPGWHALPDHFVIGERDQLMVCPSPPNGVGPTDMLRDCRGPVVLGATAPEGLTAWADGDPLVIEVDANGRIVHVVAESRGSSG